MKYDYDAIIVGAGPAGATTALYAYRSGLKVLLLDRKRFPREKTCGDGISWKCFPYLHDLGLLHRLDIAVHADIRSGLLKAPNGVSVRMEIPSPFYVVRRSIFDHILFEAAKEKVDHMEECFVKQLLLQDGQVCGVEARVGNGTRISCTARVVVGADGSHSQVSRRAGLHRPRDEQRVSAVRAYYSGVADLGDELEFHFIRGLLPGYFWIFPTGDGCANVGLCLLNGQRQTLRARNLYRVIEGSPSLRTRFAGAKMMGQVRGGTYPLADPRRRVHGNGVLLVGDAAGLASPLTGEGVSRAMHSGKLAAEVLASVCAGTDFSASGLRPYAMRLWDDLGEWAKCDYRIRRFAGLSFAINLVIGAAVRFPETRQWLTALTKSPDLASRNALASPYTYLRLLWLFLVSKGGPGG